MVGQLDSARKDYFPYHVIILPSVVIWNILRDLFFIYGRLEWAV